MSANPFLLAADNPQALLPLLCGNPELAWKQDGHGYSLVHALASYNHLDLLRTLVHEFNVDVNLRDEDEETALFVVETVEAARVLVEELGIDTTIQGLDGYTALQRISEEGDFPQVAEYLRSKEAGCIQDISNGTNGESARDSSGSTPPLPAGLNISVSTITPAEGNDGDIDPEFRRRIEQLARREDFQSDAGQAELRQLIQDAIADHNLANRNVRPRQS
ncbi:ankyrin repeat-containing protein [Xylariaceae sp. FL0662B]|nr:ankyrin repeat-containing protein [Xylariaceae sp. FL0662B]